MENQTQKRQEEIRQKKAQNVKIRNLKDNIKAYVWAGLALALAIFIILDQTGTIDADVSVGKLIITVLLLAFVVSAFMERWFFGIFIPLAIIALMYKEQLGFKSFGFWAIIAVAICLSIAFSLIFDTTGNIISAKKAEDAAVEEAIEDKEEAAKAEEESKTRD